MQEIKMYPPKPKKSSPHSLKPWHLKRQPEIKTTSIFLESKKIREACTTAEDLNGEAVGGDH